MSTSPSQCYPTDTMSLPLQYLLHVEEPVLHDCRYEDVGGFLGETERYPERLTLGGFIATGEAGCVLASSDGIAIGVLDQDALSANGSVLPRRAVLDSGHIGDPIVLSDALRSELDMYDYRNGGEDFMAAVVHPSPLDAYLREDYRSSFEGPMPREWQRQYAIRQAVGAECQEAMIDWSIDPRYRQPGDFLCA